MIITCAYCQGSGHKYGIHDSNICPVCNGAGEVNVPNDHGICNYCQGTGHKYGRHDSTICTVCHGVGVTRRVGFS